MLTISPVNDINCSVTDDPPDVKPAFHGLEVKEERCDAMFSSSSEIAGTAICSFMFVYIAFRR